MSALNVQAAVEGRIAALKLLSEAIATGDQIQIICAESNAIGALHRLQTARQDARLRSYDYKAGRIAPNRDRWDGDDIR